ncbi:unnamed protein product [Owenia fusiformis]|uniref:Threonine aspartase 1 n=1 Tax=Owenia fusiformis TaxID=6347 RepID=A0A8S4PHA3_OWEFU|nr:unnamed protein product [Owenia fusiformis]
MASTEDVNTSHAASSSINEKGQSEFKGFIALHIGAGYHAPCNEMKYTSVCAKACRVAMAAIREGKSAVDIVTRAVAALEDSPHTNAGLGSNLTIDGTVECDASIMDGESLEFGAVGALQGVKNPIEVARELLVKQTEGSLSLGRIPPCFMVGEGARKWAETQKIKMVDKTSLITDATLSNHKKYKRRLDRVGDGNSGARKRQKIDNSSNSSNSTTNGEIADEDISGDKLLDTVGAVCLDHHGNVASAVSSGGIILKQAGRVGQASVYGCGCWSDTGIPHSVAVSTTGSGEHILKSQLAKNCAECLLNGTNAMQDTQKAFEQHFIRSRFLKQFSEKYGGALILKHDKEELDKVEVIWVHSTESMCVAYMSSADKSPCATISRLPTKPTIKAGRSILVQGKVCRL